MKKLVLLFVALWHLASGGTTTETPPVPRENPTSGATGSPPVIKEHPTNLMTLRNDPATLNCAASGASRIRWFHDGEEVLTSLQDSRSHRLLLPTGSLFFLRVAATRRDSDAGTYWCVASNRYGTTRSKNATLSIATLESQFQVTPDPVVKELEGKTLHLHCRPPKGSPTPQVSWYKNKQLVKNDSRTTSTVEGDLIIEALSSSDAGDFVCRAQNLAAIRETQPVSLQVMVQPSIIERPQNVTVAAGSEVHLVCRARGSPSPTVTWRRLDGKMPLGRTQVSSDKSELRLEAVTRSDSGEYLCEAESEAGVATAGAVVYVVAAPTLTQRPQDVHLLKGEKVQLSCAVEGDPDPLVLWRLPDAVPSADQRRGGDSEDDRYHVVLTAGQTKGRLSFMKDGRSLVVKEAQPEDSGSYVCWGVSSGGGISSRAEVWVVEALPPPVVGVGPRDKVVFPGDSVTFSCEAVSEAAPSTVTWWYRSAAHLPLRALTEDGKATEGRLSLPDNGALILKDITPKDAGIYTCRISASTGTVEQAAVLTVNRVSNEDKDSSRGGNDPVRLPPPPSKPRVVGVNATAVNLTWLPNSRVTSSGRPESYTVEYWRPGLQEWRPARALVTHESCVVPDLSPGKTYTFLVRAVGVAGASFPSPWSDPITIKPSKFSDLDQRRHARRRLSKPTVVLKEATAVSPSNVRLVWETPKGDASFAPTIEGVLVYAVSEDSGTTEVAATVLSSSSSSHLVHDLHPHSRYTFFLVPFSHGVEGTPSNSQSLTTPQDVPFAAPSDVTATLREEGSILITWSALESSEARGEVTGYVVSMSAEGVENTQVVDNPWLEVRDLTLGRVYALKVAAQTVAGQGPFSAPIMVDVATKQGPVGPYGSTSSEAGKDPEAEKKGEDPPSVLYAPPQPDWLVYLLVPVVVLLVVATIIYVRRLRRKAAPAHLHHHHHSSTAASTLYSDAALYPAHQLQHHVNMYGSGGEQKLWRPGDCDKESSLSSTRLLYYPEYIANEYAEPNHKSGSLLREGGGMSAEPYATTALLTPSSSPPHSHQGTATTTTTGTTATSSSSCTGDEDSGVQLPLATLLPPPPPLLAAHPPPPHPGTPTEGERDAGGPSSGCSTLSSQYDNVSPGGKQSGGPHMGPMVLLGPGAVLGPAVRQQYRGGSCPGKDYSRQGAFPTFSNLQSAAAARQGAPSRKGPIRQDPAGHRAPAVGGEGRPPKPTENKRDNTH